MAWFDKIPNCKIREDFSSLVTNFSILHQHFCKEKNKDHFSAIAEMCKTIVHDCLEAAEPIGPEVIASFVTVLRAQKDLIVKKKEGQHNQELFTKTIDQITQGLTLLTTHTQDALRILGDAAKEEGSALAAELKVPEPTKNSKAINATKMTTPQMLDLIEALKSVPEDHSLKNVFKRAFFKHRAPTFFALGNIAAATGSGLQTGLNIAIEGASCSIKACETALECVLKDPRFYVPAALLTMAVISFGYALSKSCHYPHANHTEEKTTDIENGYLRLNH